MARQFLQVCLFVCVYVFSLNAGAAVHFNFSHLTIEDGLSNSSVLSIAQDANGFIWLGTRDGLNRYDGSRIKIFRDFYKNNPKGPNVKINQLLEDNFQNLWIATNNGLYQYNPVNDRFYPILYTYINAMAKDGDKLWIGATDGLYLILLKGKERVKKIYRIVAPAPATMPFSNAMSLFKTRHGRLIIGANDGVFVLNPSSHGITVSAKKILPGSTVVSITGSADNRYWFATNQSGAFSCDSSFSNWVQFREGNPQANLLSNNVRKVFTDKQGDLWFCTLKGLSRYHTATRTLEHWAHDPNNPGSINFNSTYDIFQDRQGNLWVGTYYGGANIIEAVQANFKTYRNSESANSLSSNIISSILGDASDNLWVGTEAEGLNYINFKDQKITRYVHTDLPNSIGSNLVKSIFRDHANVLWIGFYNGGINQWAGGNRFLRFHTKNSGLSSDNVTCISEDSTGNLWIGHQESGINILGPSRKQFQSFEEVFKGFQLKNNGITCLFHDSKNRMWIGTRVGLHLMGPNHNGTQQFKRNIPGLLGSEYIHCVVEDAQKNIWVGSTSGLTQYDPNTDSFTTYGVQSGLPGSKVVGIVADKDQKLWVSTNRGLSHWDPGSKQFINYNRNDGLAGIVFNYNSFYKNRQGEIYFGSYNGLVTFNPNLIQVNHQAPHLMLTSLSVNGKSINTGSKTLPKNIANTQKLKLPYNQANLTLEYAVLNFIKPAKNRSAYRLAGYDQDWVYPDAHRADLVNLEPGNYQLYLKGCNNDDIWGQPIKVLEIIIDPPFWRTWWAYLFYILLVSAILTGIFYFFNSRAVLKRELIHEHEMHEKQRELQKMKTDFFTHISHELRTPLTLILGPTEILLETVEKKKDEKMLNTIKGNAERLLHLTNSLMTFMKADSGALQLNLRKENIISFVKDIFDNFLIQAQQKNIQFSFSTNVPNLELDFDKHYLEMVFSNLLSNAIKFTQKGGIVRIAILDKATTVTISVCDNGPGIPAEAADKIFNEFFQASGNPKKNEGSGVGLALSKKLVFLHRGELSFTSDSGPQENKTCFFVSLKKINN